MKDNIGIREIGIEEISGFLIGHSTHEEGGTGCTVILSPDGAYASFDVRGGGPAVRETELLKPENLVEKIHGVMLSGGSAYGLAAGQGAMHFLEERGKGFDVGVGVVPIVCGASLFDLVVGDPKVRPDEKMGYEACINSFENQGRSVKEGNVGAGTGACCGKLKGVERAMKSGIGIYACQVGNVKVGAVAAVNCLGNIYDPHKGKYIAGLLNENKNEIISTRRTMYEELEINRNLFSGNTTLGCIITNAKLTKSQCKKLSSMNHDAFARTIIPVHTNVDGDTIFFMASGEVEVAQDSLGALCVEAMERAVIRSAEKANGAYGMKAVSDL